MCLPFDVDNHLHDDMPALKCCWPEIDDSAVYSWEFRVQGLGSGIRGLCVRILALLSKAAVSTASGFSAVVGSSLDDIGVILGLY